jgi:hypothetical protein
VQKEFDLVESWGVERLKPNRIWERFWFSEKERRMEHIKMVPTWEKDGLWWVHLLISGVSTQGPVPAKEIPHWCYQQGIRIDGMISKWELRKESKKAREDRLATILHKSVGPVVYFVLNLENGLIKIGTSRNLGDRMVCLRVEYKAPLKIISTIPGGLSEEKRLHLRFAHERVEREWFTVSTRLLDYIKTETRPFWRWSVEKLIKCVGEGES